MPGAYAEGSGLGLHSCLRRDTGGGTIRVFELLHSTVSYQMATLLVSSRVWGHRGGRDEKANGQKSTRIRVLCT